MTMREGMSMSLSNISAITCAWLYFMLAAGATYAADEPSVDPCSLITKAEVEEIIGKMKGAPISSREERVRICNFEFVNEKDALELWVFPAGGLERARQSIKTQSPVAGLGEGAFMTRNKDIPYIELYLKKGQVTLEVTVKQSPGDEDKVKAVAKKALSRL
jgi:hypothetical protein